MAKKTGGEILTAVQAGKGEVIQPDPVAVTEMRIPIVEEQHQVVMQRVAAADQITICCPDFEEEFGKQFILLPGGGVVPAGLRLERHKMGRTVIDKPKIGFRACPYCGVKFVAETQVVVKLSEPLTS
jgi:hypothetical protein